MDILDLLRGDGSIIVNKKLAHEIGLQEAVIYSELVSLYKYWSDREELTEDGLFYCTYENIERNTSLKEKAALRAINKLVKLGLIEKISRGLPRKNYYKITSGIYRLMDDWNKNGNENNKMNKNRQNDGTDNDSSSTVNKSSNDRQIQHRQNGGTNTAKTEVTEPSKQPLNNTRTNNTKINNTDLLTIDVNNTYHTDNQITSTEEDQCFELEKEYRLKGLSQEVIKRVRDEINLNKENINNYVPYYKSCLDNTLYKHNLKHGIVAANYRHLDSEHPLTFDWLND
ncbi:hypothetical protein ATL39_0056 [Sinobaca qinghaiensis]|uniref:Uncharacterized protein n=1 Tax=Sinobaca qinghaiensis TaxID=342944 RepID=A0A419VUB1_9BACL|nr:hypothetical protein [Sinobaca qinghaiensis]RKD84123.1 hypothetical protein ATL39_0056 [Sinobaca qinghaiensis]